MERAIRKSNFELLRIVAMLLIVAHHFLIATGRLDYRSGTLRGGELMNSFCVVGVNCFILISGYFGIKFKWSKVAWLFYAIAFVAAVDFCLGMTGAAVFDSDYAINTIIPFTKRHNWFVPTYLALMCLAPLLNKALNAAGKKELGGWVAVLTLLNLYAYFFTVGSINPNGYTLFQFIYLYVLGFYLRMAGRVKRLYSMAVYIAGALAAFIISQNVHASYTAFAYNSPQVLAASAGLFLLFSSFDFSSRVVNRLSRATFVVFLFHYVILKWLNSCDSLPTIIALYVLVFIAAYILNELMTFTYSVLHKAVMRITGTDKG